MAKQPDRWERMVLQELKKHDQPNDPAIWLNGPDIAKLLRREHKAMVRIVKELSVYRFPDGPFEDPYYISRNALMRALTERAK